MPTGAYWEEWFKEAFRSLKYGGYCIMFGMDRQLLIFKYYASLAGFEERQSMYWYFISNFPKASDLSKNLDKNAGVERNITGTQKVPDIRGDAFSVQNDKQDGKYKNIDVDITEATSPLAKKYNGYKYSISPLKQTNETIMIFCKPMKTGSVLHDTLEYENGNEKCLCGALDIDGNRCGTEIVAGGAGEIGKKGIYGNLDRDKTTAIENQGRYPAQTFINSQAGERLDEQSGVLKSGGGNKAAKKHNWTSKPQPDYIAEASEGGCSKILHKCDFEENEHDLYLYQPKVSKSERNAGCEEMEEKIVNTTYGEYEGTPEHTTNKNTVAKNSHPCLKPIKLSERILKLFKTPNPQKIIYPFAGSGSEVIGGHKAGFTNWSGCELNEEYCEIAKARIKHWTGQNIKIEKYIKEEIKKEIKNDIKENKKVKKEFKKGDKCPKCGGRLKKTKYGMTCEDCLTDY